MSRSVDEEGESAKARPWFADYENPNGSFAKNERGELTFVPERLPPPMDLDTNLSRRLIRAERSVAELNAARTLVPNPEMLVRAYVNREAVLSSWIEGIYASLEDLNKRDAIGGTYRPASGREGLREAANCASAMNGALDSAAQGVGSLDVGLILQAHRTLMEGSRDANMRPGRLRAAQNYIVRYSGRSRQVRYVPPPHGSVPRLLGDMMEFLRETPGGSVPVLVQCAMAHYQFEAVHPFPDGNGRVGRLLMPAALRARGILPDPLLCLSAHFEEYREEYYARLRGVSKRREWSEWVLFFLDAVISQAAGSAKGIRDLDGLMGRYDGMLSEKGAAGNARRLLCSLLANPYTTVPRACKDIGRTYPAGKKAIAMLVDIGALRQVEARYSGRVFYAKEVDEIVNRDRPEQGALGWDGP